LLVNLFLFQLTVYFTILKNAIKRNCFMAFLVAGKKSWLKLSYKSNYKSNYKLKNNLTKDTLKEEEE